MLKSREFTLSRGSPRIPPVSLRDPSLDTTSLDWSHQRLPRAVSPPPWRTGGLRRRASDPPTGDVNAAVNRSQPCRRAILKAVEETRRAGWGLRAQVRPGVRRRRGKTPARARDPRAGSESGLSGTAAFSARSVPSLPVGRGAWPGGGGEGKGGGRAGECAPPIRTRPRGGRPVTLLPGAPPRCWRSHFPKAVFLEGALEAS